jgi:hypothetical protein
MPSVSKAQQKAMAIAEHEPSKLNKRNRGLLAMSHQQLHDFASGSEEGKPEHVKKEGALRRLARGLRAK